MKNKVAILVTIILTVVLLIVLFNIWNTKVTKEDGKLIKLIVSESGTKDIVKITTGKLDGKYEYDIFYFGLEKVEVEFANKTMDLKEALLTDKISMEDIIEKAENSSKELNEALEEAILKGEITQDDSIFKQVTKNYAKQGLINSAMYLDGGSKIYEYETYTIIKKNSLEKFVFDENYNIIDVDITGIKDVYIGIPTMILSSDSVRSYP